MVNRVLAGFWVSWNFMRKSLFFFFFLQRWVKWLLTDQVVHLYFFFLRSATITSGLKNAQKRWLLFSSITVWCNYHKIQTAFTVLFKGGF